MSADMQRELMLQTYAECGVDPSQVAYVEAYASGEKDKDEIELNAIADVFCKEGKRKEPLLIGSSKSNVGNTEATSGKLKSIFKMEEKIVFMDWKHFFSQIKMPYSLCKLDYEYIDKAFNIKLYYCHV